MTIRLASTATVANVNIVRVVQSYWFWSEDASHMLYIVNLLKFAS